MSYSDYLDGLNDGLRIGFKAGYKVGLSKGLDYGSNSGYLSGYSDGYDDAYNDLPYNPCKQLNEYKSYKQLNPIRNNCLIPDPVVPKYELPNPDYSYKPLNTYTPPLNNDLCKPKINDYTFRDNFDLPGYNKYL